MASLGISYSIRLNPKKDADRAVIEYIEQHAKEVGGVKQLFMRIMTNHIGLDPKSIEIPGDYAAVREDLSVVTQHVYALRQQSDAISQQTAYTQKLVEENQVDFIQIELEALKNQLNEIQRVLNEATGNVYDIGEQAT